jgi:lipopolysaccharide biosynthesis glycosyltransferase
MCKQYRNIVYLDDDTIIADLETDLRDACIPDKIGAVWHDLKQNGHILGHYNVGVLAVSNTEKTRKFFDDWLADFANNSPEFPWWEQGAFNRLGIKADIIYHLGAEWNSVDYVNPAAKPVILGFHGYADRMQVMKEALVKLEGESDGD